MIKTYTDRLFYYISLILSAKKIIDTLDIKCIVCLYESGETEKAIIETNNKKHVIQLEEYHKYLNTNYILILKLILKCFMKLMKPLTPSYINQNLKNI